MNRICLLTLSLLLSESLFSQVYHDASAFEVNGHVRKVRITSQYESSCLFSEDGQMVEAYDIPILFSDIVRTNNLISRYRNSDDGCPTYTYYSYDNNGRVKTRKNGNDEIWFFYYNEQGDISSIKYRCLAIKSKDVWTSCYYKMYDSHGNWIERYERNSYPKYVKREITYWDDNKTIEQYSYKDAASMDLIGPVKDVELSYGDKKYMILFTHSGILYYNGEEIQESNLIHDGDYLTEISECINGQEIKNRFLYDDKGRIVEQILLNGSVDILFVRDAKGQVLKNLGAYINNGIRQNTPEINIKVISTDFQGNWTKREEINGQNGSVITVLRKITYWE